MDPKKAATIALIAEAITSNISHASTAYQTIVKVTTAACRASLKNRRKISRRNSAWWWTPELAHL